MSIAQETQKIALMALNEFNAKYADEPVEIKKDFLNAVQKSMLLIETQGFKRTLLHISAQMLKSTQWQILYDMMAQLLDKDSRTFQYEILGKDTSVAEIALFEGRVKLFLLCLKRIVAAAVHIDKTT